MATIYCTATSLDGFIADAEHSLSWLFSTPNHERDPRGRYGDDSTLDFENFASNVGAVVAGANTFRWVRAHADDPTHFVNPFGQPAWVVTHDASLEVPEGVQLFTGDVADLHPRLLEEAGDRDVWIVGGGDLAGQFADAGLLDVVWVHVVPVVLGEGAPLLPRRLRLEREVLERDGQFTAMKFRVVGPEPREESAS